VLVESCLILDSGSMLHRFNAPVVHAEQRIRYDPQ